MASDSRSLNQPVSETLYSRPVEGRVLSQTYLRGDVAHNAKQDGAIADRIRRVDTEAILDHGRREDEAPAVEVDREDDCFCVSENRPTDVAPVPRGEKGSRGQVVGRCLPHCTKGIFNSAVQDVTARKNLPLINFSAIARRSALQRCIFTVRGEPTQER